MSLASLASCNSICLSEAVLEEIDKKTELVSKQFPNVILDVTDVVPLFKNMIIYLEMINDDIEHLLQLKLILMPILETPNIYYYKINAETEVEQLVPRCHSYSLIPFTPVNGEDLIELLTFFASEKCGISKVLTVLKARGKTVLSQSNKYLTTLASFDASKEKIINTYPSFISLDDQSDEKFSIQTTSADNQDQKVQSLICQGSSKTLLTNLHKKYFQSLLTDFKLTTQKVIPILKKLINSRTASVQDNVVDSIYLSPPVSWITLVDELKVISEKENWKNEITYETLYKTLSSLKKEINQVDNKVFQFFTGNRKLFADQLGLSSKTVIDPKFTFKLKDSFCKSNKKCYIKGDAFVRHSNENNVRTTYKIKPLNTRKRLISDQFLIQSNQFKYTTNQAPKLKNCISDSICEFEKENTISSIAKQCAASILGISIFDSSCKYIHNYELPVLYHIDCHNKSSIYSFSSDYVASIYCNNNRILEQKFQKGTYLVTSTCRVATKDGLTTLLDYDKRPGNSNPPAIRVIEHVDNVAVHIIYISVLISIFIILMIVIVCLCRNESKCPQWKCCFVASKNYIDTHHEMESCGGQDGLSCRSRSVPNFHSSTNFQNLDMNHGGQQHQPSAPCH